VRKLGAASCCVLVVLLGAASSVRGGSEPAAPARPSRLPSAPTSSVFHVAKSENKNQVHYAVRVDERCRPTGKAPVYAYWRDFEDGPKAVSPLLDHEQPAYGLTEPRAIEVGDSGGEVRIGMRGFPDRALRIVTFSQGGECRARTFTPIQGEPAVLTSIYVELGFLFSVDYVLVRGVRVSDGRQVKEKVDD
jgi:hypothetical protein